MYVCGEYVAHLYMIVLVMNDQTKLKLLCFSRANGRWPTVDRQKYRTTCEIRFIVKNIRQALQCTTRFIVKCVAPLNRKMINHPTPPYPRFNVVEVAAGILKNDNIEAGAWG